MQTMFVLFLIFFTANNPPTAAVAHEFDSQLACERAGRHTVETFRQTANLQVRYACVPKS